MDLLRLTLLALAGFAAPCYGADAGSAAQAAAEPGPRRAPALEQWQTARRALGGPLLKEVNLELGRIKREFPTEIARIYFSQAPEWHVVVMLKRSAHVSDRIVRAGGRSIRLRMLERPTYVSQAEVQARLQRHHARLMQILPSLQGMAVDEAAGEVGMDVHAVGEDVARVLSRRAQIERLIDYPVRIRPNAGRMFDGRGVLSTPAPSA